MRPHVGNTNDYNGQANRIRDLILREHATLDKRLNEPEPKPLHFVSGVAAITNWGIPLLPRDVANAIRDRVDFDGKHTLHILTTNQTTNTTASWRAGVLLDKGVYRLEALAPVPEKRPDRIAVEGAAIHIGFVGPQLHELVSKILV